MARTVRLVFSGGLGNQLFQYATYLYLKTRHKEIKVIPDLYAYRYDAYHYGFEVQKLFDVDFKKQIEATEKYRFENHRQRSEWRRIVRLGWLKARGYRTIYDTEADCPKALDKVLDEKSHILLAGFFQNPSFVENISVELLNRFKSGTNLGNECESILGKINGRISVSLHIRRGDYLDIPQYNVFNGLDYYMRSVDYFRKRFDSPIFLIFSNDPEWVKDNLGLQSDSVVVTCNQGEYSYRDMLMMSRCNHNIIANSSFSWWGAWLNSNPNKIVVCPTEWFKDKMSSFIVPESWIKIDN